MEDLRNEQGELLRQLKSALTNFKKTPKARLNKTYVDVKLKLLEGLWESFSKNHMKLVKSTAYMSEDIYTEGEDAYTLGKCEMVECLERLVPTVSLPATTSGEMSKRHAEIKLPRITIPTFCGNYAEWTSFHDLFTSLIHKNNSLSNVQKLHYLKSSLSGEAEALLRHIPTTDANYDEAWSTLKKRFSNKRFVVNALLKRMMNQKPVATESSQSVKSILDTTNECLSALKNLGIASFDWDPMLVYITVNKLDTESVRLWEQHIGTNEDCSDELPTYKQLCVFLESRFRTLEVLESSKPQSRSRSNTRQSSFHAAASMNTNCNFCKGNHLIYHCKDFITLNFDERKNFIERNGLCYNCLIPNHTVLNCKHKTSCRRCGKRHHSLIHPENKTTDQVSERAGTFQFRNDPPKVAFTPVNTNVASHYADKELPTNVLLATAMVKVITQNGATHHLRALIDQGSQGSFITESATQFLGLNKIPINCTINGLGENGRSLHSKSMVSFQAHSIVDTNFATPVKACVLKSLTRMLPTTEVHNKDWSHLRQLELADPHYAKPGKVDLLLGADVYSEIITAGLRKGPRGSPIAQNTHLGWILTGQISSTEALQGYATTLSMHICIEDKMLQRFWEIEEGACKKHLTGEEEGCEQHFKETHTRQEDGRYAVALPFKDPDPLCQYGESRDVAKARWLQMERRLEKDPSLKKEYNEVMNEYLDLQHMQELKREDKYKPTAVYLPHHAVIRADKTTTKVRVVFDASCKYKNQVSLNDDLMVGPRLQQDLRHIIMRWRQHKVGLVADIVKMYRQVIVTQPDFQRVLWRENSNDEIRDFQMNRVTFGMASAPYLATKVLQQLAIDEKEQHPAAAAIALTDFYMDDLLTGANSYEEGISIYNEMTALLKSGGFELQKWNTNDAHLLRVMHGVDNHDKQLNLDATVKTLGIAWNNMRDEFQYSINLPEQPVVTKRTIASDISKLFDPMGWLAPTIILGKVFLQKLWLSGVTWDQEVPRTLKEDWLKYRSELPGLSEIKIERWLNTTKNTKLELHGFSDASIMAYAAVVYSRVISPTGDVHVQLISGKTKVAPIKTVSVPRLELCGAVLLAKLLNEVAEYLKVPKENIYAYTDSQVVLAWLQGHPSKWKTFIANRTSEILTTLPAHHWSHVASKENPSDLASRGVSGSMLKNEILWWKGPKWLLEGENNHKVPTDLPEDLQLEERIVHFIDTTETNTNSEKDFTKELFERFSTLEKLLRVITWCKRFGKKERYPTYLTASELSLSLTVCVLLCQREEFADDVHCLRANKPLKKRSKLRSLNPFLDEMAVLRVGGRLRHANIPEDAKHQIILPQNHIFSKLIIAQAHMKTLHGGPTLMLNYIRQKFWILGCKNMINKEVHRCVVCVRYRAATRTQLMADLPQQRVTPTRPFLHAGVDFAGPIDLRMSKGRGCKTYKGYICIWICMASKAIHIEIVSSLDSESFVAAFKRFTARRGHCSHIWSDNATNFTAGNKQLRDLFETHLETVKNQIYDQLARDGTTWHHIPASSPHIGGLWEAGVRSIKHHLRRILGNSTLTYEEMSTVTSQIEACLNSRPISAISNDVNDLLPLTPGHFLIGEQPIVVPEPSLLNININRLNRWQLTQRLFQHFWSRWSTEYLGRLQQRPKWVKQMDNDIKIGTLVLIKDDNLPPGKWPLARIIDLHPGDDGLIRVVSLKCKNTVVKRSITKICLLPVDS